MIISFKNKATSDIFHGKNTHMARKICPEILWKNARRKLDLLDSIIKLDELRLPPANRLESLSGDRNGQHSIRINDQYRICFIFTNNGIEQVEIVDYHK